MGRRLYVVGERLNVVGEIRRDVVMGSLLSFLGFRK